MVAGLDKHFQHCGSWILGLFFFFCSFASRNYVTLLTLPLLNSACCLVDSSSSLEFYQNVFQDS